MGKYGSWDGRVESIPGKVNKTDTPDMRDTVNRAAFLSEEPHQDLSNREVHSWTVLHLGKPDKRGARRWRCRCKCGREFDVSEHNLLNRNRPSRQCVHCARRQPKRHGHASNTHGKRITREYASWTTMFAKRCPVCDRWSGERGYENFLADMGPRPKPQSRYRLARRDKTASFSAENCFWERWRGQVVRYEYQCEHYTVSELAFVAGIHPDTMRKRLDTGMTPSEAVSTPVVKRVSRRKVLGWSDLGATTPASEKIAERALQAEAS